MADVERKDLSKYDSNVIKLLAFVESDLVLFLEREIGEYELRGRIDYVINRFKKMK